MFILSGGLVDEYVDTDSVLEDDTIQKGKTI